jgi:hypothetical protein
VITLPPDWRATISRGPASVFVLATPPESSIRLSIYEVSDRGVNPSAVTTEAVEVVSHTTACLGDGEAVDAEVVTGPDEKGLRVSIATSDGAVEILGLSANDAEDEVRRAFQFVAPKG